MSAAEQVILLHGFAGTPAAWDDVLAAWTAPAHPLAIAIPEARSWDHAIDQLAEICAGLPVVGYSQGARLALGLLARDVIPRALLISVNPGLDDADRPARRVSDAAWAAMLRTEGIAAFDAAWTAQPLFASAASADPARRARRHAARLALDPERLARNLETVGLAVMPDLRPAVDARAHLIVGDRDPKFVTYARAACPPATMHVLAGVGHDPTLEAPEIVAEVVAGWID